MICGIGEHLVDFIHKNHAICRDCLQGYLRDREIVEDKFDPRSSAIPRVKCPVPSCKFKFVYTCAIKPEESRLEYSLYLPLVQSKIPVEIMKIVSNI